MQQPGAQDARTVNVIATALLADTPKLACTALNFFLNIDTQMADDDDEEGKAETAQTDVGGHFLCDVVSFRALDY